MKTITFKKDIPIDREKFEDLEDFLMYLLLKKTKKVDAEVEENLENYEFVFDKPVKADYLLKLEND